MTDAGRKLLIHRLSFFARMAKNDIQEKQSTMLPQLQLVLGKIRIQIAYQLNPLAKSADDARVPGNETLVI
jgi:hypothetical protein